MKEEAALSQWQLIRRRFVKHRLATFSLAILSLLYATALFAEFAAPYAPNARNLEFAYCPPQLPRFSIEDGLYVRAMVRTTDPITFRQSYHEDPQHKIPLGFFVRGEPYKLWGLIPAERRLFGMTAANTNRFQPDNGRPSPSFHFLGTDRHGQDIFSRIVAGSRISLSIGLLSIAVTLVLGVIIGGLSGYCGGSVDNLIQRSIEVLNAFPQLPLWLALAAVLPADWDALKVYFAITVVLSLLNWTSLARVVRGKILSLREEDYAVAARLLGASHSRIIFRHLVPGFTSHIIVVLTLSVPYMILGETALSFLGLGLRPPVVSWGVMLQDSMNMQAISAYPWLLLPVFPIVLTVLCFNFLGDGMRDAADPYSNR